MKKLMLTAGTLALLLTAQTQAQQLSGNDLVEALQGGGYVIVMRHGSASVPTGRGFGGRGGGGPGDDAEREPVLDNDGIGMATAQRFAFRELKIPVGDLLTSPTQRTREHASHFGFGEVHVMDELGTDAMRSDAARSEWLAAKAAEAPRAGTNTVIVTHAPNIEGAFGISNVAVGESVIVRPGNGVVARLSYADWATLALD